MLIRDIAASPVHRIAVTCEACPTTVHWEGAALALRFDDSPDLTLADVRAAAICPTCGGDVSVIVERSDEDGDTSP